MATLSSPGIGSGLDINGIVSQLMALERRPLDLLQQAGTQYKSQLSAFGKVQDAVGALRDAATALTRNENWTPTTVASSDTATVAATSTGSTPAGSYSVSVSKLAAAQTVVGNAAFASAQDTVGSGVLTIELGRWGEGMANFAPAAGSSAVTIAVAPGRDSLEAVRDAINAAKAGVTASIVTDASGARLVLRSTATGIDNGFRVRVAEDDGSNGDDTGLSRLAFDPETGVSQMTRTLAAANAEATINGVPISSASNTLSGVLDGLTVRLSRTTRSADGTVDTPVQLAVDRDNTTIKKSVTDFAKSYNDLIKLVRSQTSYDDATKQGGVLQGDRSVVGLLNSLRSMVGGRGGASTVFARLADVGLEPQRDGTLSVNDSKLDGAIGRLDELQAFFKPDLEGTTNDGFGVLLRDFAAAAGGSEGVLTTRQDGLRQRIQRNDDGASRMQDRLALTEKRLRETYSRLDTNIANLTGLQNYVSQQITTWNKR